MIFMRRLFSFACFAFITLYAQFSSAQCDKTLWNHVYNNYRLVIHDSCATITGTVQHLIYEADGDIHIRLILDSPYLYMLNSVNASQQYNCLVLEPICATTITQADAVAPCSGLTNTVYIPAVGEHVQVTGSYVTDNDHGWNEIHPVTQITITGSASVQSTAVVINPVVTVFPDPAKSFVNFRLSEQPSSPVHITIYDQLGRSAGHYQMLNSLSLEINTRYLPSGKYYYYAEQNSKQYSRGEFIVVR